MIRQKCQVGCIGVVAAGVIGCAPYPKGPARVVDEGARCWAVRRADRCDYFQYLDSRGKVTSIAYDDDGDGREDVRIDLAAVAGEKRWPHYVILLDGVPFRVIDRLYDEGRFRLFHRPSKLISCFPSMTDAAFARMFTPGPAIGYEALWYDRARGRTSGGKLSYLAQTNASWQRQIDYRSAMIFDPVGYVSPGFLFKRELRGIETTFNRKRRATVIAYSVGTATVGTRKGEAGLVKCLQRVDELCEKLVYQRRGQCRITILADHGHNLTASKWFDVTQALRDAGFRVTDRLRKDNDVVCVPFGLVTYSALYTAEPAKVAAALTKHDPVEMAMYPNDDGAIVVCDRQGRATITKVDGGYVYRMNTGDPLQLEPIVAKLTEVGKVTDEGVIGDDALFAATVDHVYPDPLARIHLAFNGLVRHPADVIVTVKDGWFCGAKDLARSVTVASTHGSLNQVNSATFVMSTIRALPPGVRIDDVTTLLPEMMASKSGR